jgi:hypothetical protein
MSLVLYAWALIATVALIYCLAVALRCWVRQAWRKPTQPRWDGMPRTITGGTRR